MINFQQTLQFLFKLAAESLDEEFMLFLLEVERQRKELEELRERMKQYEQE